MEMILHPDICYVTSIVIFVLMMVCYKVDTVDMELMKKLESKRSYLMQEGLSFFNGTTVKSMLETSEEHNVRCLILVENWSKWLMDHPVYFTKYGDFQAGFHDREVFPAHRELIIGANNPDASFTGTSGTIAWKLGDQSMHLIVMWSIPYYTTIYNAYFAVGMVNIYTKSTRDMLPFWYKKMLGTTYDKHFERGKAGSPIVFKHTDLFIKGSLGKGYHSVLNITIQPWNTKDLAPSIWHKLYLSSLRNETSSYSGSIKQSQKDIYVQRVFGVLLFVLQKMCWCR